MAPSATTRTSNAFCLALDRVREERDDAHEEAIAGRHWADLDATDLPPCRAEAGAFMSARRVDARARAPVPGDQEGAGHAWAPAADAGEGAAVLDVRGAVRVDDASEPGGDRRPPPRPRFRTTGSRRFHTAWVFGRQRQEALLDTLLRRRSRRRVARLLLHEGRAADQRLDQPTRRRRRSDHEGRRAARVRERR